MGPIKIDPELWPEVSRLLDQWLELPQDSRLRWLENLDTKNAAIIPLLRQLVTAQPLGPSTLPRLKQAGVDGTLFPGALVGPYRLIRELGQGGMGVVWLAAEPFTDE